MTKVGFHPNADLDLREAVVYYETRVPGLGEELLVEVERVCTLLREHPSLGAPYDVRHSRALLRRFPFALIYRMDIAGLVVVAVAHTKRQPDYWRGRI